MFPLFALALKAFIFFLMALAAAHAWGEHHQKLLGVRCLGGPEGFTMGDADVRCPVATRFEHGVDFGLLVHKFPFMADKRDPLVLSNYIFELLEVNPGVAGFLIQLHTEDVDAVVESVTAHAEKSAGTKTTLYVGQEEEEQEVEEEEEDAGGWGAGGRKEKPPNLLMISVQKVRIRPGKGKGKSDGWFPQPLTGNTRRVCTDDPENKLPMHSLCPTREWEREWYGVTTPNIISGQGVILSPFGATPPLIGEAEEVVVAEPLGAFNRDPNDLVLTGKLDERPPPKGNLILRVCFLWEGEYTGREVWQKLHRGGGIHQVGGYDPPLSVVDATADWVRQYAPKGGRPGKGQTKRGPDMVVVEPDAPPPPLGVRAKPPPPSPPPSHRRWQRWRRPSPPMRPWTWRPWGPVWPPT